MHISNIQWYRDQVSPLLVRSNVLRFWAWMMLLAAYLPVFTLYASQHWSATNLQGAYAHAPLTVLLIGYLIWRQRANLVSSAPEKLTVPGLSLLAFGVALKIYGDIQGYVVLQGMSLIPVLFGLLFSYHGATTVRALRFPILFLLFIIPLPVAAIDAATVPLINATAELVTKVLPLLSIEVVKIGHVLTVSAVDSNDRHEVILAPECSGIRSLVSVLALSCIFAHLRGRKVWQTTTLMLGIIPLIILSNCIRVSLTVLMIVFETSETVQNQLHFASGLVLFAITLSGLLTLDALLKPWTRRRQVNDD